MSELEITIHLREYLIRLLVDNELYGQEIRFTDVDRTMNLPPGSARRRFKPLLRDFRNDLMMEDVPGGVHIKMPSMIW